MAEAGKRARGAAVGSETQARRNSVLEGERVALAASVLGLVGGLGPAGEVEMKDAQRGLQDMEGLRIALPADLAAMKPFMLPEAWDRVLERRALELVQEEAEDRKTGPGSAFQRGYQAAQWSGEQVKAQGAVASGAEQALKERASLQGLTGWAAPNVPERGVWAELENLRHQVLKAHQSAEALVERLVGALVPAEELVATRVPGPTPPSRLSEEVHLVAVSVVQVQDLLEGLLGRLDL